MNFIGNKKRFFLIFRQAEGTERHPKRVVARTGICLFFKLIVDPPRSPMLSAFVKLLIE